MWERDVPLRGMTRWKIGGAAPLFARAGSVEELRGLLGAVNERVLVLGQGANLLVADEGPGGPVVVLEGDFKSFDLTERTIRFGAAAPIAGVVQEARRQARVGLWILEAVPGTMGGALRMNAGSAEQGIWDRVLWAQALWPDGELRRLTRDDVTPAYRRIALDEGAIFLGGELDAPPGDAGRIEAEHQSRRESKLRAQVYDQPTCGSTWKNPAAPAPSAWELVEKVGMRGARRGDAAISSKHANFIVNLGEARAQDVVELMLETRRRVREETGIELEPEIRFWGFPTGVLRRLGVRL
jgi:UDP-N-acetylmuramate dehydrogenase